MLAPRTLLLTALTMAFFAANSLLARVALRTGEIDAASFTAIRIASGAVVLAMLTGGRRKLAASGSWRSAFALFVYAAAFSFAYLSLNAGTGALVLFAAVQITMLSAGIIGGERPSLLEWVGLAAAFGGLVYLVLPGLEAPSPVGALLMAASGVGWGCYSLAAKGVRSPVAATAGNFLRAVPFAIAVLLLFSVSRNLQASWSGVGWAVLSGGGASGLGYAVWYFALQDLRPSLAAIVQLTVPILAAAGGVMLLREPVTGRLALASAAILGGVAIAVSRPSASRKQ